MQSRTALYIFLPIDASKDEVEAAHQAIDNQFSIAGNAIATHIVSTTPNVDTSVAAVAGAVGAGATATTSAAASAPGTLDGNGLPWDARIHSSNQKINGKGLWWAKKGVDDTTRLKIEAELRSTLGAGAAVATEVTQEAPASLPPLTTAAPAGLPPMPGANLPDPAYTAFVKLVADNTNSTANPAGRITEEWLKAILTHYGVAEGSLQNLAHAPTLIAPISEYITNALKA